jgi:hypothetical protein
MRKQFLKCQYKGIEMYNNPMLYCCYGSVKGTVFRWAQRDRDGPKGMGVGPKGWVWAQRDRSGPKRTIVWSVLLMQVFEWAQREAHKACSY